MISTEDLLKMAGHAANTLTHVLGLLDPLSDGLTKYFDGDFAQITEYIEVNHGFTPYIISYAGKIYILKAEDVREAARGINYSIII